MTTRRHKLKKPKVKAPKKPHVPKPKKPKALHDHKQKKIQPIRLHEAHAANTVLRF
jgi:hypothetical protein